MPREGRPAQRILKEMGMNKLQSLTEEKTQGNSEENGRYGEEEDGCGRWGERKGEEA